MLHVFFRIFSSQSFPVHEYDGIIPYTVLPAQEACIHKVGTPHGVIGHAQLRTAVVKYLTSYTEYSVPVVILSPTRPPN